MQNNNPPIDDRHATLERTLIDEFLGGRGLYAPRSQRSPGR